MAQDNRIEITIAGVDKFSGSFSRAQASIVSLNQALDLMGRVVRTAQNVWRAVEENVLRTTDSYRKTELQLTQLTGSNEKATAAMTFLLQAARDTPNTLQTLNDVFVKLTVGGVKNTERGLLALTDAVAAFGGTDENLKRAAVAIQQMGGKGVVSMEELRQQLGEAIPTASKVMASELGMTLPAMFKLIETGGLEAGRGLEALFRGLEKEYKGSAKKMTATWSGATSSMSDAWAQLMRAIGESGLYDAAIDAVQTLAGLINDLTKLINTSTGQIRGDLDAVNTSILSHEAQLRRLGGFQGTIFGNNDEKIKELGASLAKLYAERDKLLQQGIEQGFAAENQQIEQQKQKLEENERAVKRVREEIEKAQEATDLWLTSWLHADDYEQALADLETQIADMTKGLEPGKTDAGDTFAGIGNQFAGQVAGMSGAIAGFQTGGALGAAIGFVAELTLSNEAMRKALDKVNEVLAALIAPLAEAIAPALEAIAPVLIALQPIFEELGDIIGYWVGKLVPIIEWLVVEIESLIKYFEHYSAVFEKIFMEFGNLTDVMQTLEKMGRDLEDAVNSLGKGMTSLRDGVYGLIRAIGDLPGEIYDAFTGGGDNGLISGTGTPLDQFHEGGLITPDTSGWLPGMKGDERLAVLQTGERVLKRGETGGAGVNINIQGSVDERTLRRMTGFLTEQRALGRA